ncbi:MAG: alkene reductase, partial [Bacteroidales bacterium]|nr:alkene reductase [Bacteroidales bacterium]
DPVQTYSGLVRKLNELHLAYLHLVEPLTEIPETYLAQVLPHFRKIYQGRIITAGGYDPTMAAEVIHSGEAEMVAFGRLFISNPDLSERIRIGEHLIEPDQRTFYTGEEKGYTDYPFL